jgi:glutaminyl-peptide cyclotransferase
VASTGSPPQRHAIPPWTIRVAVAALAILITGLIPACDRSKPSAAAPPPAPNTATPSLWKEFSGEKAMEHVKAQVGFGPRPSGTSPLEKARTHIADTLKSHGWEVERQEFEATPVAGKGALKFVNVIARFPKTPGTPAARDAQRVIMGSHYDTKRMSDVTFVGANDGASSTGALLELARVLATVPSLASQIELIFFDGEEAIERFGDAVTGTDGLVGSRYYARNLRDTGRAKQFRFAIVWDMIGDKDLKLTLPSDTPPKLAGGILTASEALGLRKHVGYFLAPVLDDHEPIARIARIPAMDMIDFDYPAWHTGADTLDRLSPDSLRIVGQITLWYLERELAN